MNNGLNFYGIVNTRPPIQTLIVRSKHIESGSIYAHWQYMPTGISGADPESFIRGGPTLITFISFLVDERRDDPNTTKSGSSSAASETFRWHADDGPTLYAD